MHSFRAIESKPIQKYVRYIHEIPQLEGYLQASETDPDNIYAQQRGEESPTHPGMVNIKCIYNGKYWVPEEDGNIWVVAAHSGKKNYDIHSPKCTLFVIEDVDGTTVRLHHPALDRYVCLHKLKGHDNCLALLQNDHIPPGKDVFALIYDEQPK